MFAGKLCRIGLLTGTMMLMTLTLSCDNNHFGSPASSPIGTKILGLTGAPDSHLGNGYDVLLGERKESCLDETKESKLVFKSIPKNETYSTFFFVKSRRDLAEKLELGLGVNISGTFRKITPSVGVKSLMIQETSILENEVTGIVVYQVKKKEKNIENSNPLLTPEALALLKEDKLAFRDTCGDKYTKSITKGASLYLIVKAKSLDEMTQTKNQHEATLKVGLSKIFSASLSGSLSEEDKRFLSKFSLSIKCYSEGTLASPCTAEYFKSEGVLNKDRIDTIIKGIIDEKIELVEEVKKGKNIVTISEVLKPYTASQTKGIIKSSKNYFDHDANLKKIDEWLQQEEKVNGVCAVKIEDEDGECAKAEAMIEEALENCSYQENLSLNFCRSPAVDEFSTLLSAPNVVAPVIKKVHEGVYIFSNQAGPVPHWWIACLYSEDGKTLKENDCGYTHNQTQDHLWDIWYVKDSLHADEYKVIMPAGREDLCLTAQDDAHVVLTPCSKSEVTDKQKWNWWANSDRDEAWAKNVGLTNDNCLDANSGNIWTYKCKHYLDTGRHNQLWQFGKTPNHN